MESLIAFLLDNIFIVIVALGFLMSLFGKSRQRGGRMPDFGGGPMQAGPGRGGARRAEPAEETVAEPSYAPAPASRPYAGQRMEEARQWQADDRMSSSGAYASSSPGPASASRPGRFERTGRSQQAPQGARTQTAASAVPSRIDADDLRQAVLWAEILGPPRARKPHGRNRIV